MTIKIFITAIIVFTLASCGNNRKANDPKQETPNALQDKSFSNEIGLKRGYDDLVESLYNELVSKDIDLEKLEGKIDDLHDSKSDSTTLFDKFNNKNQLYFNSANRHLAEINDSVVKQKVKVLIADNITKYNASIAKHNDLLKMIEDKGLTISDLHTILKIVKTLPLIEKYQKENLPNTKSLEGYSKQHDETIKLIDTLTKK